MIHLTLIGDLSSNNLDTQRSIDDETVAAHITNTEYDAKFVISKAKTFINDVHIEFGMKNNSTSGQLPGNKMKKKSDILSDIIYESFLSHITACLLNTTVLDRLCGLDNLAKTRPTMKA